MAEKAREEFAHSLETQYEPLDPALIRAILSEYDHIDTGQLQALHDTLETLRAETVVDDTSSFDPSGTSSGIGLAVPPALDSRKGDGQTESGLTTSSDTDLTSVSHDSKFASLDRDAHEEGGRPLHHPDATEAEGRLLELFPSQTASTISHTLKKCNGSFDTAVDVLLNHVYFDEPNEDEDRILFKSIDAFGQGLTSPRRQKGKRKKRPDTASASGAWSSTESLTTRNATPNHWDAAAKDIDFLALRTNTPTKAVQSIYNGHGASIPATILAIIEQHGEAHRGATSDDPVEELNIATLASEFPSIPIPTVAGLVRVAEPSTAHAHELARALTSPSQREADLSVGGKLVPQYTPLRFEEDATGSEHTRASSALNAAPLSTAALASLRSNAFSSASQYHRKAGSDRLFGGAAAYYGQLGREYNSQLRAATSSEADALVASQSSGSVIDLHGVSVADAVRIAGTKTSAWWDGVRLKEGRSVAQRVGDGLVFVTGRGAHSKDGRARIGPAVTRALMAQGWKVEVRSGELAVMGKAKK